MKLRSPDLGATFKRGDERVLRRVRGIATTHFSAADVVRHPLVARIVEAYDAADRSGDRA